MDENSPFRESELGSREEHSDFGSPRTGLAEKLSDSLVNTALGVTDPFPLGPFRKDPNGDWRVNRLTNHVAYSGESCGASDLGFFGSQDSSFPFASLRGPLLSPRSKPVAVAFVGEEVILDARNTPRR